MGGTFTKYATFSQKYIAKINCTTTSCTLETNFFGNGTSQGASALVNAIAIAPSDDGSGYDLLI